MTIMLVFVVFWVYDAGNGLIFAVDDGGSIVEDAVGADVDFDDTGDFVD